MDTILVGEDREPRILLDEIRCAMAALKNGKSPGADGIPAELLKGAGEVGIRLMHRLCNIIWCTGKWPEDWTKAVFVLLPNLEI